MQVLVGAVTLPLMAAGCAAEDSSESLPDQSLTSSEKAGPDSQAVDGPSTSKPTLDVDGPTYDDLEGALPDGLVVVRGEVTRKLGSVTQVEPGSEEAVSMWATYELKISDLMGAQGAKTVTIVDFDRSAAVVEDEGVKVGPGLTGYWVLNTADREGDPVLDSAGYSYYPVYFSSDVSLEASQRSANMGQAGGVPEEKVLEEFNHGKLLRAADN